MRAGIDYLSARSDADGDWQEEPFTGTGFPKVFYLKYHLYQPVLPADGAGALRKSDQPSSVQYTAADSCTESRLRSSVSAEA